MNSSGRITNAKPRKLPNVGKAQKHIRVLAEKTKKPFEYPDGIDIPMLDPIIIPFGYSQSYLPEKKRWVLFPDKTL